MSSSTQRPLSLGAQRNNTDPKVHPLRILIATDAAREGVNLQNHCADLFHFDMPWNPSRMEQRNGRIDRKLQRATEVRCHYFVFKQRPEDRVLQTLVRKTRNIEHELGSLSPVLESKLGKLIESGIRRRDAEALMIRIDSEDLPEDQRSAVDEELEQAIRARQKLLTQQMTTLRDLMAQAKEGLGLDEEHLRSALCSGLELAGGHALEPDGQRAGAWRLRLDDPLRSDPAWLETMDTLRAPRSRTQSLWEWRKAAPIRPLVFSDTGQIDDTVVHAHLEHRLVQRLLGRFLSQGFVFEDLSRATVVVSDDPIPRVVLLGRLSLYGDRASRLHDEVVAVSARWVDPSVRMDALKPYADETKTLGLLDEALKKGRAAPAQVQAKLAQEVERDVKELEPHLHFVGAARAYRADELLFARGQREKKELIQVLEDQRKRIEAMLEQTSTPQLSFRFKGFNDDEKRQLEADQRHWRKRLGQIDAELKQEPDRIVRGYETRAKRVDPIAIVFLWPVTG